MTTKLKNQLIELSLKSEDYFEVKSELSSQQPLYLFIYNTIKNLPTIMHVSGVNYLVDRDTYGYVGYEMYTFTKIDELDKISLGEM